MFTVGCVSQFLVLNPVFAKVNGITNTHCASAWPFYLFFLFFFFPEITMLIAPGTDPIVGLSQCISDLYQYGYSYFNTACFIIFCLQNKMIQFSRRDKSSIWQILMCEHVF